MKLPWQPAAVALALTLGAAGLPSCDGPNRSKIICDCAQGQRCISGRCVDLPRQDETIFEPSATRAVCPPPTQVFGGTIPATEPAANVCSRPVVSPALPSEWIARREVATVGTELTFEVPPGASALSIVLQVVDAVETVAFRTRTAILPIPNTAVPLTVTDPTGRVWFDDRMPFSEDGTQDLVFFALASPFTGTITIPNTTRALELTTGEGLPAGTWRMVVSDYAYECAATEEASALCGPAANLTPAPDFDRFRAGVYDATVVVRAGPAPEVGALDLAIYVHPCPGGTYTVGGNCIVGPIFASAHVSDPATRRFTNSLADFLAAGGICLGTVTWYDLPDWARDRWRDGLSLDANTPCDHDLGQLLSLGVPGRHMNLFLVPTMLLSFQDGTPGNVVGIDGTIPGPSGFSGTVQGGAAASAEGLRDTARCGDEPSLNCGPDLTAYIAAHEIGHFLGLYHTSESSGLAFDPIADTPTCACSKCAPAGEQARCANGSGFVIARDCLRVLEDCGGGRNLMFWLLGGSSTANISPEQSRIMRANPLVR